ncbi:flagellar hook protein FlgE [Paucidesulfovibrio gracilis DSM 16080]|uniref:Flagellar hook protein FlgE n=1 Tax=Paucidesulfovibrio gracilis DSM 16080 TaxID=1121449 RepID=A0A1T4Y2P0_9BACT|nr:flagellar hook protein FlgE [Paucidesulfovibrio gracilis]SKA96010.1 flagellar hook protein FlgE [Paucidesulfovibrio gracilis DSM 16080]
MSLASSLYSGITGLSAHGERMSVIGNNLANVNTTGYKGARMHFEDLMSQDFSTANGISQVGRGVRVAAIYTDYGQGAFETTNESTDMAIGGEGFFMVSPKDQESQFYTRAGTFRFDKNGYLVDPHGYVLQGWEIEQSQPTAATTGSLSDLNDTKVKGAITDIRLENFQSPPEATNQVSFITNLDPTDASRSNSTSQPYFALFNAWDGLDADNDGRYLADTAYSYSSSMKVYDDIGTAHTMTTYFDQVTLSNSGGYSVWEYMVTVPPSEDGRFFGSDANFHRMSQTSNGGVLMTGTLTFRAGQLVGQSAYTYKGSDDGNVGALSNWSLARFSTRGYPLCTANFLGSSNASLATSENAQPMEINFGLRNTASITTSNIGGGWSVAGGGTLPSNASMVGNNITDVQSTLPNSEIPSISALASQSFDTGGSSTLYQSQDGYPAGILQNVSVSRDGILTGRYSNGQVIELYKISLATFTNEWGLRREGGNLFTETQDSGQALTGFAGEQGKGTIDGNSLEMSNVDMAAEFVRMITTQRGFQANTKVITTTDSMLGEVIAMKR